MGRLLVRVRRCPRKASMDTTKKFSLGGRNRTGREDRRNLKMII